MGVRLGRKFGYIMMVTIIAVFLIALVGCASGLDRVNEEANEKSQDTKKLTEVEEENMAENDGNSNDYTLPHEEEEELSSQLTDAELASLKVNELGQVMVLMYHVIGDKEDVWSRTRDNFRSDLQRLYELGYRTVTLTDFLTGNINIPAGTTPVILTFDDGTIGQFRFLEEDGELVVDPESAVGIMLDFAKEYPEFGNAATFYINFPNPFGQLEYRQEKLEFLAANGMEIGNHTYNHANLSKMDDEEVQRELAQHVAMVQQAVLDYQVNSLALPFGISANNKTLEMTGEYDGVKYNHLGVLRVGANPSYPVDHQKFDATRIPRVRADQTELDRWLSYFANNPHMRYVSDGNKDTLVIPEREKENLLSETIADKELIIYSD